MDSHGSDTARSTRSLRMNGIFLSARGFRIVSDCVWMRGRRLGTGVWIHTEQSQWIIHCGNCPLIIVYGGRIRAAKRPIVCGYKNVWCLRGSTFEIKDSIVL